MTRQTMLQVKKESQPLQTGSLFRRQAAPVPVEEHDIAPVPVGFGRDYSHIPFRPPQPPPPMASVSCPFSPQRCPFGGVCHACPPKMQAKLKIGQPGDRYEQEADRVAEQVMRMPEPQVQRKCAAPGCKDEDDEKKLLQTKPLAEQITPLVQRQTEPEAEKDEDEDEIVQVKSASSAGRAQADHQLIQSVMASPGQPLDTATRSFMEPRFGQDFSGVRVHVGGEAAESARSVNARAYTVGRDVVFGEGEYAPGSDEGRRLVAHELAHTIQQRNYTTLLLQKACPVLSDNEIRNSKVDEQTPLKTVYTQLPGNPTDGSGKMFGACPLTYEPPEGGGGTEPNPAVYQNIFNELSELNQSNNWVRAHLLHGYTDRSPNNLHGPGEEENLIVTDKALNGVMRRRVEECALRFVHTNKIALWYEAKVNSVYSGHPFFAESITVKYGLFNLDGEQSGGEKGREFASETYENRTIPPTGNLENGSSSRRRSYEIKSSTSNARVFGPVRSQSVDQEKELENLSLNIRGLSLKTMHIRSTVNVRSNIKDRIDAVVDIERCDHENEILQQFNDAENRIHIERENKGADEGKLFIKPRQHLSIHPAYLSDATIENLTIENDAVSGTGTLRPSLPILNSRPMQLELGPDRLRVFYGATQRDMRQRSGLVRIKECSLGVDLLPEFRPSGELSFSVGPSGRDIVTGQVTASADADGLVFDGSLDAHIPNIDEVRGEVHYRNHQWSGFVVINSSQIRFPGIQRGELRIDISNEGIVPSGNVELLLPRNLGTATLGFSRDNNGLFVFTGAGRLRVPGLREVDIRARYNGTTLTAEARNIGFTWHGLNGQVDVIYTSRSGGEGEVTGTGVLELNRGNVTGRIELILNNSGRFSGRGTVNYPFNIRGQQIQASAAIIVNEQQEVRVEGAMRVPQPIELFRRFGDNRQLFSIQRNIPIPGLSIGPVGIVAVIEGRVSVHYFFGPGQLRNVAITTAFNPLEQHPNPNIAFAGELYIPANAGIAATIGGGLGVEAGLGSVTGTLSVTGALDLNAVAGGALNLQYANRRFELNARPGIEAGLDLGLSLDAHARARAGIGRFSVGTEKFWNLGSRQVSLGRFSMYALIHYSSDEGLQPPALEWGPPPQFDISNILQQLFSSASAQEREQ